MAAGLPTRSLGLELASESEAVVVGAEVGVSSFCAVVASASTTGETEK
jgi:hypothetical protein